MSLWTEWNKKRSEILQQFLNKLTIINEKGSIMFKHDTAFFIIFRRIAVHELGTINERRIINQLRNNKSKLANTT